MSASYLRSLEWALKTASQVRSWEAVESLIEELDEEATSIETREEEFAAYTLLQYTPDYAATA